MTPRDRYEGLQTVLEQGGKYGCLFLCLCSIVEECNAKPLDIIDVICFSQAKGWLGRDFYCANQLAFLDFYTGKKWERRTAKELGDVAINEYTVEKWAYNNNVHFKRRSYDVYKDSKTVRYGNLDCYYVYSWRI